MSSYHTRAFEAQLLDISVSAADVWQAFNARNIRLQVNDTFSDYTSMPCVGPDTRYWSDRFDHGKHGLTVEGGRLRFWLFAETFSVLRTMKTGSQVKPAVSNTH